MLYFFMRILTFCLLALGLLQPVAAQEADSLNELSLKLIEKNDYEQALPLIEEAALKGNAQAQFNLAVMYHNGVGLKKNDSLAMVWYKKSAESGNVDGMYMMGRSYFDQKNYTESYSWYGKAASNGDNEAHMVQVNFHLLGLGMAKDSLKAVEMAKELALKSVDTLKSRQAMIPMNSRYIIARWYREGFGTVVKPDPQTALAWYMLANEGKYILPPMRQNEVIYEVEQFLFDFTDAEKEAARQKAETLNKAPLQHYAKLVTME